MAKGLALDLAPSGITVNVVAPGWFDSPLAERWKNSPELGAGVLDHTAQRRWGARHRPGRRVPVPRVRRVGVRHGHRAQRRRRIPARMSQAQIRRPGRSHASHGRSRAGGRSRMSDRAEVARVVDHGCGRNARRRAVDQFAGEPDTDVVLSDVSAPSLEATVERACRRRGARSRRCRPTSARSPRSKRWSRWRWSASAGSTC